MDQKPLTLLSLTSPPYLKVYSNFLTEDECSYIINVARTKVQRSTVIAEDGSTEVQQTRTSRGCFIPKTHSQTFQGLSYKIADILELPEENSEDFQILCYKPGELYVHHWDYFLTGLDVHAARGGQRVATMLVYLNTPTAGGETELVDIQTKVAAVQGNACSFKYPNADPSSKSMHGGNPVIEGEKWVLTQWYRERKF